MKLTVAQLRAASDCECDECRKRDAEIVTLMQQRDASIAECERYRRDHAAMEYIRQKRLSLHHCDTDDVDIGASDTNGWFCVGSDHTIQNTTHSDPAKAVEKFRKRLQSKQAKGE